MRKSVGNRGFTLLEVILAMAILAILVVGFLPVFINALRWVTDAGKKSDQLYNSQNAVENRIVLGAAITGTPPQLQLNFTDTSGSGLVSVALPGEDVIDGSLRIFLPAK